MAPRPPASPATSSATSTVGEIGLAALRDSLNRLFVHRGIITRGLPLHPLYHRKRLERPPDYASADRRHSQRASLQLLRRPPPLPWPFGAVPVSGTVYPAWVVLCLASCPSCTPRPNEDAQEAFSSHVGVRGVPLRASEDGDAPPHRLHPVIEVVRPREMIRPRALRPDDYPQVEMIRRRDFGPTR